MLKLYCLATMFWVGQRLLLLWLTGVRLHFHEKQPWAALWLLLPRLTDVKLHSLVMLP